MIYFQNHRKSVCGFNNHVLPYTLCISLSNFFDRDFFFDHEYPSDTPPDYALHGELKEKFSLLLNSKRSLVSDLVQIPNRRRFEIEREVPNKISIQNIIGGFMTTQEMQSKYQNTMIWQFFSLGREALIKEELQHLDLIEIDENCLVNISYYYFLNKTEKAKIFESAKIKYRADIENLAKKIGAEIGRFGAIHLRLGDFPSFFRADGYSVDIERCKSYFAAIFAEQDLPILVATDGLHEKEMFAAMLGERKYIFIDELIFDEYEKDYAALEFTDFNVLTVLNQLLCADAEVFAGTCRSTLTSVIHRLRQERYGKTDFNFIPDARINRLLTPDFKLKPDGQGFFEWNRYSIFNEVFTYPAWMREWNYELTSLNF